MGSKAALSFWSADALIYFLMPTSFQKKISSEFISRISAFLDAYILFDKVILPERYKKEPMIQKIDYSNDIFEFISSDDLIHSDDLKKGVTIDLSFNYSRVDDLLKEDFIWLSQHNTHITKENYEELSKRDPITMTHLRLWQLGLTSEISDKTNATSILPLSLQGIESIALNSNRSKSFVLENYDRLSKYYSEMIVSVSAYVNDPLEDYLSCIPPFFAMFIDRSINQEHGIEVLIQLRRDFSDFRKMQTRFQSEVMVEKSLRRKKEIISEWNSSWATIMAGDFRKPQLMRRKVADIDVAKAVVKPNSAGIETILKSFLEYREQCRSYKRFKIYSDLYNELETIKGTRKKLFSHFNISDILLINS